MKEVVPIELSDGSIDYGDGRIGPNSRDQEWASSFRVLPNSLVKSANSENPSLQQSINSFLDRLPVPVKVGLRLGVPILFLAFVASCADENSGDSEPIRIAGARIDRGEQSQIENGRFLDWPYDKIQNINVQRAWKYVGNDGNVVDHRGIDYILGEPNDYGNWESFEVFAAAEGKACKNPRNRQGEAVFIQHVLENDIKYTYYGHLKSIDVRFPSCTQTAAADWVWVERGATLGFTSSSGLSNPDLVHLHFQVNNADGSQADPYDLYSFRVDYPDEEGVNGKFCGENTLWINCPTKETEGTGEDVEIDFDEDIYAQKTRSAMLKAQDFFELLKARDPVFIDRAEALLATQEELDWVYPNQLSAISRNLLEQCSEQMEFGNLQNQTYSLRSRIQEEAYLEGERGRWVVGVNFRYARWSHNAGRRLEASEFNAVTDDTTIWFEEFGGELKIVKLPLCDGPNSPLSPVVGQPTNQ